MIKLILWGLYFLVQHFIKEKERLQQINNWDLEADEAYDGTAKHPAADNLRWY